MQINKTKFKTTLIAICTIAIFSTQAQDQLATWDFQGKGGQNNIVASSVYAGVAATATASVGAGLSPFNYLGNGLTATEQTQKTLASAISNPQGGEYFSFTIAPVQGRKINISKIYLNPVSQGDSTRTYVLFSSKQGFTESNAIASFQATAQEFNSTLQTLIFSGHDNITTPIEFRLYVHGHNDPWQSVGIGNSPGLDLIIDGKVMPDLNLIPWIQGGNANTDSSHFIGTNDLKDFKIKTNNQERITVLKDGNVGIGVALPTSKLDVDGDIKAKELKVANAAELNGELKLNSLPIGQGFLTTDNANKVTKLSNGTIGQMLTMGVTDPQWTTFPISFSQNGNIGIGTSEPLQNLHINSNSFTSNPSIRLSLNAQTSSVQQNSFWDFVLDNNMFKIKTFTNIKYLGATQMNQSNELLNFGVGGAVALGRLTDLASGINRFPKDINFFGSVVISPISSSSGTSLDINGDVLMIGKPNATNPNVYDGPVLNMNYLGKITSSGGRMVLQNPMTNGTNALDSWGRMILSNNVEWNPSQMKYNILDISQNADLHMMKYENHGGIAFYTRNQLNGAGVTNPAPLSALMTQQQLDANYRRMTIWGNGKVTIGNTVTNVLDASTDNIKLEVAGNIKLTGLTNGIIFPDGTKMNSSRDAEQWSKSGNNIFYDKGNVVISTTKPYTYGDVSLLQFSSHATETNVPVSISRFNDVSGSGASSLKLSIGRKGDESGTYVDKLEIGSQGLTSTQPWQSAATIDANGNMILAGKLKTKEVAVVNNPLTDPWPDYVFDKNYPLTSIDKIEEFVSKNKHLPEIPSAKEVEKEGVALGKMNGLLLKKIEELTLLLIKEHKSNVEFQERLSKIESQLKK